MPKALGSLERVFMVLPSTSRHKACHHSPWPCTRKQKVNFKRPASIFEMTWKEQQLPYFFDEIPDWC